MASIVALLLYLKFGWSRASNNDDNATPSLFENIYFMRNEVTNQDKASSESPQLPRKTSSSQSKKRRPSNLSLEQFKPSEHHQHVSDLLTTLGIKSDASLNQIVMAFRPLSIGQGVKLNSLVNIQEKIVVVQSGEVKLEIKEGNFQLSRLVKNGGVIYSKLSVINYLLNFHHARPEDIPMLETTKPTTLLLLPLSILKNLTNDEAINCSISQFIAEIQKIVIDAFCGELGIPLTSMFKYETTIDEDCDVAQFLSKKLDFHDEKFLRKKLIRFTLEEGEQININGYSHDIGLVMINKGTVHVYFTENKKYVVKNSWFGFVSLLSSPTGTPFPPTRATNHVEGYILTRSTFKEMCQKHHLQMPMRKAAKRILKSLSSFIFKSFYTFDWKTVQGGTQLFGKDDPVEGVYAVIRGRLRKQGQSNQDDYFLFGVFDCILERPHMHSVVAARASELCYIPSEVIKAIKDKFPTVQNRLVRVLGEQLLESWKSKNRSSTGNPNVRGKFASSKERPLKVKSMTIFGATTDVQLSKFALELATGISFLQIQAKRISSKRINDQMKNLTNVDPGSNPHLLAWLRDQERSYKVLIYQCDPGN